jgi:surface antigen
MKRVFGSWIVLGLVLVTVPAMAQINPFRNNRTGVSLSSTDFDLLGASINKLNKDPKLAVGAEDQWSNPATGSHGTSKVTRIYASGHMPCHVMHHEVSVQGQTPARGYDLTWCRAPNGQWKVRS